MTLATGLLIYFLSWWMIWFILLPIGVVTQEESGKGVVKGTHKSAPVKSRKLLLKAGITSVLAGVAWAIAYYLISQQ